MTYLFKKNVIVKTLISFIVFSYSIKLSTGQEAQNGRYLVANYEMTALSPLITDMIRQQIPDDSKYSDAISMIGDQKFFFTLTYDTHDQTSFYKLDSINRVAGVKEGGNYEYVIKSNDGKILGKENIINAVNTFEGDVSEIIWEITDETTKIGNYECTKAIMKNLQYCSVWFTAELPIMAGPDVYHGLPGLVLQSETALDITTIKQIQFVIDDANYQTNFNELLSNAQDDKKKSPLSKIFNSKNNMITMMVNILKQQSK